MSYPVPRPEGPSTAIRAQNLAITIPGRYGMVCSCNSYNYALAGALSQVQTKKDVCVNAPVPLITSSNGEYPLCLNGGGMHHHKTRHGPKPDWTEIDPEDGSSGVTYTW